MKSPPPPLFARRCVRNRVRYIFAAFTLLAIAQAAAQAVFIGAAS